MNTSSKQEGYKVFVLSQFCFQKKSLFGVFAPVSFFLEKIAFRVRFWANMGAQEAQKGDQKTPKGAPEATQNATKKTTQKKSEKRAKKEPLDPETCVASERKAQL